MKLLTNPLMLRLILVLIAAAFAFLLGMMLVRRMRRRVLAEAVITDEPPSEDTFPLHTFHAVIQELKQQKYELQRTQQAERRRAKTSENISAAILANLSSGVMFFASNGLVRQANAAAREILGFASPLGMNAQEVFRDGTAGSAPATKVCDAVRDSLDGKMVAGPLQVHHVTPAGEPRVLDINLTTVRTPGGEALGTACLITDRTEIAEIRRQQELRGEMSAEMALALRSSLATISGYAQQLATTRDPDLARQVAADIAAEAGHLNTTIGGFLSGTNAAKAAAGS